jgi:hypothetical protein
MSPPGRQLWRALNVLQRIAGFGAAGTGAIFAGWTIWYLMNPSEPLEIPQFSSDPRLSRAAGFAFSTVLLALAAVLLRARPYRPDLGDPLTSGHDLRPPRPTEAPRRWWTGDPID